MAELLIKYVGIDGKSCRVSVDRDRFTIGRHSENDLTIADSRLSREHAVIERFGDVFVVNDRGSSNGTTLNGEPLTEPRALNNGDRLSLGGFDVELDLDTVKESEPTPAEIVVPPPSAPTPIAAPKPAPPGGIPTSFFVIAPLFGLLVLILAGVLIYFSSGRTVAEDRNVPFNDEPYEPRNRTKKKDPDTPGGSNNVKSEDLPVNATPSGNGAVPVPSVSTNTPELTKTENNASAFLKKIAQNDPRAFVTGEQAKIINAKIKSLSSSPALASNINSARKNAAQIKALAVSKNLKPDLLAVAAITKLGSSSGDVLATAQSMAETLDKLSTQVGNESGDDCVLMMAAYNQGAAGDFMKLRNTLQSLATKMPDNVRGIRTIWYLKKYDKITDAEYDMALRFLATGAITQNPKDFGVNIEPLAL
ncbi:MAG: FHA domain-containing protein [Pyrinomonadaceae bacterium]|nr:FHA domain-containing protein [Pyrinomonadaceae bacterium]MBP6213079.1 FHA domain-containing protein [Pyrinomonadaceae bacterium]